MSKKDVCTTTFDPGTVRVFIKGVEITELVIGTIKIEGENKFLECSEFGKFPEKYQINRAVVKIELDMSVANIIVVYDDAKNLETSLFISELPTDDFIAEMVRLKLRRAGVL
uniref:Uncharacterized protein n=1 Tax=viral metagenome TaxID=1070528 RepID=A0A6M3J033_9ZZZZ